LTIGPWPPPEKCAKFPRKSLLNQHQIDPYHAATDRSLCPPESARDTSFSKSMPRTHPQWSKFLTSYPICDSAFLWKKLFPRDRIWSKERSPWKAHFVELNHTPPSHAVGFV